MVMRALKCPDCGEIYAQYRPENKKCLVCMVRDVKGFKKIIRETLSHYCDDTLKNYFSQETTDE